jgi:hypothetical protein
MTSQVRVWTRSASRNILCRRKPDGSIDPYKCKSRRVFFSAHHSMQYSHDGTAQHFSRTPDAAANDDLTVVIKRRLTTVHCWLLPNSWI